MSPKPAHAVSALFSPQPPASWKCFSFSFSWVYYKKVSERGRFYVCLWSRCSAQPCWSLLEARSTLVASCQGKSVSSIRRISVWALLREHPQWIRAPYSRAFCLSSKLQILCVELPLQVQTSALREVERKAGRSLPWRHVDVQGMRTGRSHSSAPSFFTSW